MNPLVSWILFLGISGTVYIALKGIPFLVVQKHVSDKNETGILAKKVRKKRRFGLEKVAAKDDGMLGEPATKYRSICVEESPLTNMPVNAALPSQGTDRRVPEMAVRAEKMEMEGVTKGLLVLKIDSSGVEQNAYKASPDGENMKTKKQKQNAMKREKQKQLKARVEKERLKNLRQHQKTLEEERLKELIHHIPRSDVHAWHSRSDSGEWIVVGSKGNRHVPPVCASTTAC